MRVYLRVLGMCMRGNAVMSLLSPCRLCQTRQFILDLIARLKPWWVPQCLIRVLYFAITNFGKMRLRWRLNRIQRLLNRALSGRFVVKNSRTMAIDNDKHLNNWPVKIGRQLIVS